MITSHQFAVMDGWMAAPFFFFLTPSGKKNPISPRSSVPSGKSLEAYKGKFGAGEDSYIYLDM